MAGLLKLEWDPGGTAAANARHNLPKLAAAYFAEARTLLAEAGEPAHLHRLRLISKRLRYTLELFRPCYGPGLDERIAALKGLQDLLGETNDAVASAHLIAKMTASIRMRRYLERRAAQKAAEFRAAWRDSFDAPGREVWWTGYLGRAGRGRRPAARKPGQAIAPVLAPPATAMPTEPVIEPAEAGQIATVAPEAVESSGPNESASQPATVE